MGLQRRSLQLAPKLISERFMWDSREQIALGGQEIPVRCDVWRVLQTLADSAESDEARADAERACSAAGQHHQGTDGDWKGAA